MSNHHQNTPAPDAQVTDDMNGHVTDDQQDNDTQVQQDDAQVTDTPRAAGDAPEATDPANKATEAETFPREYVEKLRKEAADNRAKAKRADDLAHALFVERVRATGRLADPTDLPYSDVALDDPDELAGAIDELLGRKPHLASRRPRGDVGQGSVGTTTGSVDLAGLLRARV